MALVEVEKPNLTDEEIRYAIEELGREPNEVEWAMLEAEWSEHCSYKSSKQLLKLLPTTGPKVLVGPGFDAGVVNIGDDWVLTLHIESHNHPSAIDPYGGAATGVGGVVRDILSLGTRPIALLDPLRFGSLNSPHSRWLFDNVVRGIGDYGNCVSAKDLVYFTNSDDFHIIDFESFFSNYGNSERCSIEFSNDKTTILRPKVDIKVLTFDFENRQANFRPVNRIYRMSASRLLKIHTALGRVISVTPDHPMFVVDGGNVSLKRAADLTIGDAVPLLCGYPFQDELPKYHDIDIITELANRGREANVGVRLAKTKLAAIKKSLLPLFRKAGIKSAEWCHYFRASRGSYLPLRLYLKLENLGSAFPLQRTKVLLHRGRGRVNPIPAIIRVDSDFARLIGYFLSEGCRHDEARSDTSRIIWTFREEETEYIDDVCSILAKIGIRYSKRKSSPTTVQVKVSSSILGFVFREVLACGKDSYSMQIPSLFYRLDPNLLNQVLKGVIRGDGSLRATSSEPIGFRYATTSSLLFQQVLLLMQSLGYVASIREARNMKSKVPINELEVHGKDQVESLKNLLSSQLISKAEERLREYRYPKLARYRFEPHENFVTLKVTAIEELTGDFPVYNFEVAGTHNFVTTGGVITHNCIGVPTVGGEVEFDESFERNCLVDVVCIGLGKINKLVLAEARNPGDLIYLVGGSTGRDGIRGASFASRTLTDKSETERSAVQVPDPFTKKLIIEAVLEAVDKGLVRGMKDLGGGGLTCGLSEIAAKTGTGIEVDLDRVRTREPNMQPAELMISESQERMLLVIKPEDETELVRIFDKYEVAFSRIGHVTRDGSLTIRTGQRIIAKAPATFIAEAPPATRLARKPSYLKQLATVRQPALPADLNQTLLQLLSDPNIASKEWVYRQYDHEVGLRTIIRPGQGDAAILRLPNDKALAVTTDGNSKTCYLSPYWGTVGVCSEAISNLIVSAAEPIAVVDHLQFGNPDNPEVYWTFKEAVHGVTDYLNASNLPCVGGKVSFYNEDSTTGKAIKPSPVIAAIGLLEKDTRRITPGLKEETNDLIIVGETRPEMGGSEYYEDVHKLVSGPVPKVQLSIEKNLLKLVLKLVRSGHVESAHDCSKGGLGVALAEMAIQGQRGFTVDLEQIPAVSRRRRTDTLLFAETPSRFLLETKPKNTRGIIEKLEWPSYLAGKIGRVYGDTLEFTSNGKALINIGLSEAMRSWSEAIPRAMEGTP